MWLDCLLMKKTLVRKILVTPYSSLTTTGDHEVWLIKQAFEPVQK